MGTWTLMGVSTLSKLLVQAKLPWMLRCVSLAVALEGRMFQPPKNNTCEFSKDNHSILLIWEFDLKTMQLCKPMRKMSTKFQKEFRCQRVQNSAAKTSADRCLDKAGWWLRNLPCTNPSIDGHLGFPLNPNPGGSIALAKYSLLTEGFSSSLSLFCLP